MDDLKTSFPPGVDYAIAYDTTPFVRESVQEVFKTLRDAVILVAWWCWCFCRTGARPSSR